MVEEKSTKYYTLCNIFYVCALSVSAEPHHSADVAMSHIIVLYCIVLCFIPNWNTPHNPGEGNNIIKTKYIEYGKEFNLEQKQIITQFDFLLKQ